MDIVNLLKVKYITYNSLEIVFFFPEKQNYEIKMNWISNDNCELLSFGRFCCNIKGFFCVKLSSGVTCGFFEGLTQTELRYHARSNHQHQTSWFWKKYTDVEPVMNCSHRNSIQVQLNDTHREKAP